MPELRRDPEGERWTVIAESRAQRPEHYRPGLPGGLPECPFCEGHEGSTPPELDAVRARGSRPDGPGWRVRVIPNLFPTFEPQGPGIERGGPGNAWEARPALGAHEVVVLDPSHERTLAELPSDRVREVLEVYRRRWAVLRQLPGVRAVLPFHNYGPDSGGSLPHPHSQIVATAIVPPLIASEVETARAYGARNAGACLLESVLARELQEGSRVVYADPRYVVLSPFASRTPFEMQVVPRRHSRSWQDWTPDEVDALSVLLPRLLRALHALRPSISYNFFVHLGPEGPDPAPLYHWHLDILTRISKPDAFELGTGIAVNQVPPEAATQRLRELLDPRPA